MRAAKFIIATGGYQEIPSIDGFDEIGCLTHETILNLEEKPDSLAIVGAGPVGVEYAQTLSRLGVKVCLIEYQERVLPREEPEVSALVESILLEEGVIVHTNYSVIKGIKKENEVSLSIKANRTGEEKNINCRQVMVATGKTPSTKELGLDKVGVERDEKGFIKTDRQQRTSLSHIWACGDVCGLYQFTHYADHTAQIAALNAAYRNFIPFIRRETEVVPWCTFFDPEVASVGMRVKEASDKYGAENIHVLNFDLSDFDRAILDQEARGFMLAVVNKKGKILGATIIGARAGEIIHEFSIAMKNNISITALSKTIHVYPTMSAAVRSLAAQYYKTAAKDSVGLKMAKFLAARLR